MGKAFSGRLTPLFLTMVIQNQSELGEGSAMPIDPHHTPTILQPSSSQPQKTQKTKKPKRKDTQVPQPSDPTEYVTYAAVYKELGDSLVMTATIASSLKAYQDSGNINKTQSKATTNEFSSQGTNSGGGPRCHETIGNTTAQTRFESVSKHSKFTARKRVLELEKTKTTLYNEIASLKRLRSLKRRIEEPVKPKKKDQIKLDEEDTLKLQAEFDEEERLAREKAQQKQKDNIALIETEMIFKQRLMLIINLIKDCKHKNKKRKRAEEKMNKPPTQAQKRKIVCTYLKNMKGYKLKDLKLKEFDYMQKMFEKALKRVNTFKVFRTELVKGKEKKAGEEQIQESTKEQKMEDDKETKDLKQFMVIILDKEEEEIDAIPLAEVSKDC
nr:hypothetical protein [Tanacetum cinerariifolium]